MKFVLIIGDWIKNHIIVSIVGIIVVGGTVTTSIILLNQDNDLKPNENIKEEVKQDNQEQEPEELELNEDGCPVGFFLNYYGICQDEHLYEPQECQDGYIWNPDNIASYENYEDAYGIDGLPKGACQMDFDTQNAWYIDNGYPTYSEDQREEFEHIKECGRGFFYNPDTKSCTDMTVWERSVYEKRVLSKHDPKDDLSKCSERSETDQACLKD